MADIGKLRMDAEDRFRGDKIHEALVQAYAIEALQYLTPWSSVRK
jgi:hypothetical protein